MMPWCWCWCWCWCSGWSRSLAAAMLVCRRWGRVARDEVLWRQLHVALLGPHRWPPLPWLTAFVPRSPSAPPSSSSDEVPPPPHNRSLSKRTRGSIIDLVRRLLSVDCYHAIWDIVVRLGGGGERAGLTWYEAFKIKAPEVAFLIRLLAGNNEPVICSRYTPEAQKPYLELKRAALLGCDAIVDRLKSRVVGHSDLWGLPESFEQGQSIPCIGLDAQFPEVAVLTANLDLLQKSGFVSGLIVQWVAELGITGILCMMIEGWGKPDSPFNYFYRHYEDLLLKASCRHGRIDYVRRLCAGATKDFTEDILRSALIEAVVWRHLPIVKFLCEERGVPLAEEVVLKALKSCSEDMLCYFIRERMYSLANVVVNFEKLSTNPLFAFPLLKLLIEEGKVDFKTKVRKYSHNALFAKWAVARANDEVCRYLVSHGVDINAPGVGGTPLLIAVRQNDQEHARCLIRCGAQPVSISPAAPEWPCIAELMEAEAPHLKRKRDQVELPPMKNEDNVEEEPASEADILKKRLRRKKEKIAGLKQHITELEQKLARHDGHSLDQ